MVNNSISKSWFCVLNNPEDKGFEGDVKEITEGIADTWCDEEHPTRSCAVIYCVSAKGLKHCHAVFEDIKAMRFSVIKRVFPTMHIQPTKGNKEQAEDYILKKGDWVEKGESILYTARRGVIKGAQGKRRDIDAIGELIEQGYRPNEIMNFNFSYRRYESMIRGAYFDRRAKETPVEREVTVYWHCGPPGSGKTHTYIDYCQKYGEDDVYLLTDISKGGFDRYCGERYLFIDEFRGQLPYFQFLNYLDGYKIQIPCRYTNSYALWNEVHITTVIPPEEAYQNLASNDSVEQLYRRIDYIVYHYKDSSGYQSYQIPFADYKNFYQLQEEALNQNPFIL